tara:strand:+ start:507 stop:1031 length:525 start_codon:yes stop_codon:yes gene_type:complete
MQQEYLNLPYKPVNDKKWLEKYLGANYYKKKYDRFMWWRSYTPRKAPLGNKHSLRDRILNGDFDIGPYIFEIQLAQHKMNEKFIECKGYEDTYREAIQIDKARVKRLKEDRDKDEFNKLEDLKKSFLKELKMTSKQYDREITNFRGKDLITFYYRMEDKFQKYTRRLKPVPKIR